MYMGWFVRHGFLRENTHTHTHTPTHIGGDWKQEPSEWPGKEWMERLYYRFTPCHLPAM